MRPGEPDGRLRLPLGRHPKPEGGRASCLSRRTASSDRRTRRSAGRAGTASGCGSTSIFARSTGTSRTSSWPAPALASIWPLVPATKLWPQNSSPSPPAGPLAADPVAHRHVAAVGHRVAALDRLPGAVLLARPVLGLLLGMPADRGRIEENLRPLQGRQAGRLGIPLVPADQDADLAVPGVPGAEAGVARGEIELLVDRADRPGCASSGRRPRSAPSASITAAVLW